MSNTETDLDEIFFSNKDEKTGRLLRVKKKNYHWLIVKVSKRKNLSEKLENGESELISWSNGMMSLLVGKDLYDVVSSQDARDLPVFIDPNSAIIYFGFSGSRATLRPSLNILSEIKLREDKPSKIMFASSGKKESGEKPLKMKKEKKLTREDLEDFLEGESSEENPT